VPPKFSYGMTNVHLTSKLPRGRIQYHQNPQIQQMRENQSFCAIRVYPLIGIVTLSRSSTADALWQVACSCSSSSSSSPTRGLRRDGDGRPLHMLSGIVRAVIFPSLWKVSNGRRSGDGRSTLAAALMHKIRNSQK
jgi:hypothetical protein